MKGRRKYKGEIFLTQQQIVVTRLRRSKCFREEVIGFKDSVDFAVMII
jgi:hypothetical protein